MAVTSQLNMSFLRGRQPGDIHAEAEMLRLGRRLAVCDVRLLDRGPRPAGGPGQRHLRYPAHDRFQAPPRRAAAADQDALHQGLRRRRRERPAAWAATASSTRWPAGRGLTDAERDAILAELPDRRSLIRP